MVLGLAWLPAKKARETKASSSSSANWKEQLIEFYLGSNTMPLFSGGCLRLALKFRPSSPQKSDGLGRAGYTSKRSVPPGGIGFCERMKRLKVDAWNTK
jgi:hypothetical protein